VSTTVVIGADGVESNAGTHAGLDTRTAPEGYASSRQMTLGRMAVDPQAAEFHVGESVAPGGYALGVPEGPGFANVGLGVPIRGAGSASRSNG